MTATAPLRIERIDAGRARVAGALGFAEAAAAAPRWREFAGDSKGEVAVDVSGLEQVDSATLAVLLAWAAHARRAGARLRYVGVPEGLAALARLAGSEALLGL